MADADSEGFTAKDFRTWGATVRAIAFLAWQTCSDTVSEQAFTRCIAATAKQVAEELGNTPAVCRKSYINPVVFTAWRAREIERYVPRAALAPRRLEKLALQLLRAHEKRSRRPVSNRRRRRAALPPPGAAQVKASVSPVAAARPGGKTERASAVAA